MTGLVEKFNNLLHPSIEEEYDEFYEDEVEEQVEEEKYTPKESTASIFKKNQKVVSLNQKAQLQVVVYRPISYKDDTGEIAKTLLSNSAVVVNLEKTEKSELRRILDFLSGVAFAINGKLTAIATDTYMITPSNVNLTGEEVFAEFENSGVYF